MASDRFANDRQAWLLGSILVEIHVSENAVLFTDLGFLQGLPVHITTKHNKSFLGIFAGTTTEAHESTFLFKMVREASGSTKNEANGVCESEEQYTGAGADHSMAFGANDILDFTVADMPPTVIQPVHNGLHISQACEERVDQYIGVNQGFRTDTDISGHLSIRERDLQRWQGPTGGDPTMTLGATGEWDQFEANEQRFGLKSDYDENLYTTKIDRSHPLHRLRENEAERVAAEIMADVSSNAHTREERGIDNAGVDEEDRLVLMSQLLDDDLCRCSYSGVRRNGQDFPSLQSNQPDRYMPPARRNPTNSNNKATGGSVDPAIISAQIASSGHKTLETRPGDTGQLVKTSEPSSTQKENGNRTRPMMAVKEQMTKAVLPPIAGKSGHKSGAPSGTATENVEVDLLNSYRQFANTEKMRLQDNRRHRASADKAVKLNDLLKFASNFKLLTPVPGDLVPILAKDKEKQKEIVEKAQRNSETAALMSNKARGQSTQRQLAQWDVDRTSDHHVHSRGKPSQSSQMIEGSTSGQNVRAQQGLLSHRLADSHRQHKAGMAAAVLVPLPIQDGRILPTRSHGYAGGLSSPSKQGGVHSPTSATSVKLNVKAMEFKPNPTANAFKPGNASSASSPRAASYPRSVSRAADPSIFFGSRQPLPVPDRSSSVGNHDLIKYLKQESETDLKLKEHASNGDIQPAYRTPPTWSLPKDGEDFTSYNQNFDQSTPATQTETAQHRSPINPPLPHQHQLPFHMQNGTHPIPQVQTPQQLPHPVLTQPHPYSHGLPHYDDHHMRPSVSSSSVFPAPSPRMQHSNMAAYPSPMSHPAQLAYSQIPPQYVVGAGGAQAANYRGFSAGQPVMTPHGPHLAAPMMMQQSSAGGYVNMPQPMNMPFNPSMAMYPGQAPPPYGVPPQPPSGYPSPARGAPMMMHQTSHQGQHQPVFLPPQYGQPVYAQHAPPNSM